MESNRETPGVRLTDSPLTAQNVQGRRGWARHTPVFVLGAEMSEDRLQLLLLRVKFPLFLDSVERLEVRGEPVEFFVAVFVHRLSSTRPGRPRCARARLRSGAVLCG